jgi:hypothetical protein
MKEKVYQSTDGNKLGQHSYVTNESNLGPQVLTHECYGSERLDCSGCRDLGTALAAE